MGLLRDASSDPAPDFGGRCYATWRYGDWDVIADWSVPGAPTVELEDHSLPVGFARHLARLLTIAADRAERGSDLRDP